MSAWIEPIADRNQSDIENKTPKAFLNMVDINRIEGNIAYLSETLSAQGYHIQPIQPVDWERSGIPKPLDMQKICDNIEAIVAAYYEPDGYADLAGIPDKTLDYADINKVESNLWGIKALFDAGLTHNYLHQYTYGQLKPYTHKQLRKGIVNL
ncbi:MAG TPA: hypothetical protein DEB31_10230 [Clostridiales bacterium]|nr:hypothetical protein [Clostridiales bacterium]